MSRTLALLVLIALAAVPTPAAARDRRIVRDSKITALYALNGTILYARHGHRGTRWMRVVDGVRSRARHAPADGGGGTVGIDSSGHVIVTLQTWRGDRGRWWVYNVTRDRLQPLALPRGCQVDQVAIWRSRTAFRRSCGSSPSEVVVKQPSRTQSFRRGFADFFAMRGRSVVGGTFDDEAPFNRVFLDRGRRCPDDRIQLPPADHTWHALYGIWIGAHGVEWAMGSGDLFTPPVRYADVVVMAVHLDGRCAASATRWRIPTRRLRGVAMVAIDGRYLYYVTENGLYRRRLTSTETAAPPANDAFAQATPLSGDVPLLKRGVVGHATREPADPADSYETHTVWYGWRPAVSERVVIGLKTWTDHWSDVFTGGPAAADLAPAVAAEGGCFASAYDVVAGRQYWIEVGTFGAEPSYEPFTVGITRGPLEHC